LSVKLHLIFFLFFGTISSSVFCSCNYWTEHLRLPPSSELRQAPLSLPIVAGRRCPFPWLCRSSHGQPPARCFCSAPTSSPMVSGYPRSHLAPANLAPCSTRRARPRSDSLRPWPRSSTREDEDAEPRSRAVSLARAALRAWYGHLAGVNTGRRAGSRSGVWRAAAFGGWS